MASPLLCCEDALVIEQTGRTRVDNDAIALLEGAGVCRDIIVADCEVQWSGMAKMEFEGRTWLGEIIDFTLFVIG